MRIVFTSEEVRRLVLMGIYESNLLRHVDGLPTVTLGLSTDGSIYAICEVDFDADDSEAKETSDGGAN